MVEPWISSWLMPFLIEALNQRTGIIHKMILYEPGKNLPGMLKAYPATKPYTSLGKILCIEGYPRRKDNFMIMKFDDIKGSTLPIAQCLRKLNILESVPASTVSPEDVLTYIRENDKRLGAVYRDRTAAPVDRNPTYITAFQDELKGISRNHLKELQSTYSALNRPLLLPQMTLLKRDG